MSFVEINLLAGIAYTLIIIAFALAFIIFRMDRKSSKR